jgi:hypothetical protein
VTITSKRLDEVQTLNSQRDDTRQQQHVATKLMKDTSLTSMPSNALSSPTSKMPSKKAQIEGKKTIGTTRTIQMSSSAGQIVSSSLSTAQLQSIPPSSPPPSSIKAVKESNYTPSISSIGSNVLRSKTADFERMSDSSKKSRISAAMNFPALQTSHNVQSLQAKIQSPTPNPNVTNISISLKTTAQTPKKKSSSTSAEESAGSGGERRSMPIYKRQEIISSVQKSIKK